MKKPKFKKGDFINYYEKGFTFKVNAIVLDINFKGKLKIKLNGRECWVDQNKCELQNY